MWVAGFPVVVLIAYTAGSDRDWLTAVAWALLTAVCYIAIAIETELVLRVIHAWKLKRRT